MCIITFCLIFSRFGQPSSAALLSRKVTSISSWSLTLPHIHHIYDVTRYTMEMMEQGFPAEYQDLKPVVRKRFCKNFPNASHWLYRELVLVGLDIPDYITDDIRPRDREVQDIIKRLVQSIAIWWYQEVEHFLGCSSLVEFVSELARHFQIISRNSKSIESFEFFR